MTFPPPQGPQPGYSPVPPQPQYQPQAQAQAMGPGGAYGQYQAAPGQPMPGQMPSAQMTMAKPGTVTGIQVILWIFLAIGAIGDVFSVINMINFFHPLSLIALGYALYTTVQSLLTPIHIARGKRWAWIWNLVSAIIGLVFALVGIVFGIIMIETTPIPLLFGLVFAALDGTLLGLLVSKSARSWILMHRIQRGEVQVSGSPGAPGAMGAMGMPGPGTTAPEPERPATRPGVATFAVIALWSLAGLSVWGVYVNVSNANRSAEAWGMSFWDMITYGDFVLYNFVPLIVYPILAILAVITAPLITKGKAGGRIFCLIWSIFGVIASLLLMLFVVIEYLEWGDRLLPGQPNPYPLMFARHIALIILMVTIFVLTMVPGVRRWTPRKPSTAMVMMVPMGQPMMQPQPGYAQQQQAYPPQQQPQYPPPPGH